MPKRHMGNKHSTDAEAKSEQAAEPTPEVIAPEDEVHPHIDAETPHVDPTGLADFDRPYDQWSNDDLKIRAKQLGVLTTPGGRERGEGTVGPCGFARRSLRSVMTSLTRQTERGDALADTPLIVRLLPRRAGKDWVTWLCAPRRSGSL